MISSGLFQYFNYPLVSDSPLLFVWPSLPTIVCGDTLENKRSGLNALSCTFYMLSWPLENIH